MSDKRAADSIAGAPARYIQFSGLYLPRSDSSILENVVTTVCNGDKYQYGYNGQMKVNEWAGAGNHNTALYWEYDTRLGRRGNKDDWNGNPSVSPYSVLDNSPIWKNDVLGNEPDFVQKKDGSVKWDNDATSQSTTKPGETYLGKNVLVGTHNRDAKLNEPINSAKFDLYLESNKEGPTATIMGNTVPADNNTAGTLAEGLYKAVSGHRNKEKYKNELALRICNLNGKDGLPTVNGNRNPRSDGKTLTGVLFHIGNQFQESLKDSKGHPYSEGCQTSHNGKDAAALHADFFMNIGKQFNGNYYLRSKPVIEVPKVK